jgi:hypothetical protein
MQKQPISLILAIPRSEKPKINLI